MKKIFNILVVAAVALGAVACQNNIEENATPAQGESLSISVTIADQTRVALGEFEEGKGYKLSFEEGDQLYIVNGWADSTEEGYYFDYTKQENGTYTFTCTADGVSGIVGDWKGVYYLGGRKNALGGYGDTEKESLNGVFMNGAGTIGGTTPIVLDVAPVLKLKSDYAVTISASDWIFCNGTKSYTTKNIGDWTYVPVNTDGTYEISASVMGTVVKSATLTLNNNTIYNLGTIEAAPEEQVNGETNVAISIDGVFTDWEAVTKNAVTLPATVTDAVDMKELKACMDSDNLYVYAKVGTYASKYSHMSLLLDLDNDQSTGGGHWYAPKCAEVYYEYGYLRSSSGSLKTFAPESYYEWDGTSGALVAATAPAYNASVVLSDESTLEVEISIPRTSLDAYITSPNIGICAFNLTAWTASGILPVDGTLVIPVAE